MRDSCRQALCLLSIVAVCGCSTPAARFDEIAAKAGLTRMLVRGTQFDHVVYVAEVNANPARRDPALAIATDRDETRGAAAAGPIWVYIEGDGVPWIDEIIPADDPTPRTPVALRMLVDGPRPAVFLGRPCYLGMAGMAPCAPLWWTHYRYSPEVVVSMVRALQRLRTDHGWAGRPANLVGFSGGGTLAVLMAPYVDIVCAVVTLAAPLDTDEWTARRGYSRLEGSANPALLAPLPEAVRQLHLRGGRDAIVDTGNGAAFRARNPNAVFRIISGLDHRSGWADAWRETVQKPDDRALAPCRTGLE